MKTLIAALAAVTTVTAIALPAAAQPYDRNDQGRYEQDRYDQGRQERGGYERRHGDHDSRYRSFDQRQDAAYRQIDRGLRNGNLSRREGAYLQGMVRALVTLEARYSRNGLSRTEVADLNYRYGHLETQIRSDRRDRDHRPG